MSKANFSQPNLFPEEEDIQANGFAWSNKYGIMLQSSKYTIFNKGNGSQWLGTQQ